ncbi:MAG: flavin-dependent oxidoreductase [Rhodospirillaceae bacterium]|nr:flavin-dependent oxidoreductase [Rhodospirillaceae bacterium]
MKALIIGGGIGGLSAALTLHARGIETEIFEQSSALGELGVGINTLPHAIKELAELGLLEDLIRVGIQTSELTYANRLGQTIWQEPRGKAAGYDYPQFSIHRGKLLKVLADAAAMHGGAPRTGHRFTRFEQGPSSVTAYFDKDGAEVSYQGDLLIGADGIHSSLRAIFFPGEGPPLWDGVVQWRGAVIKEPWKTGNEMMVAGPRNSKFIYYPISNDVKEPGKQLVNWTFTIKMAEFGSAMQNSADWTRIGDRRLLEKYLQEGDFQLGSLDPAAIIRATDQIFEYPRCDRDPLPYWSRGRVTLLGDAAHAMYPVGSNGASQAILDARCLADCLAGSNSAPDAIAAYEDARRPPTTDIIHRNRRGGPEQVIDLVEERAPEGFDRLADVVSEEELLSIIKGYSTLAGFEKDQVNK